MKVIPKNFKNNKFLYYLKGFFHSYYLQSLYTKTNFQKFYSSIPNEKLDYILKRVNYYNKIENNNQFNKIWPKLSDLRIKKKRKNIFF